jgi:prepilin-type N-terminal cleavage/methylation domain-containing protein
MFRPPSSQTSRHPLPVSRGFSLIEMSIVLLLVALLLGSILVPLSAQVDQRRASDTEKQLDAIKESLIGFAIANRYLPCPAVSATNGAEDRTGTACTGGKRVGFLPWVTLGITRYDSWANLYRYSVTPAFSVSDPANLFNLVSVGDITLQARDGVGTAINLSAANSIPVVVLSHGKNGYGATSLDGAARAVPASWTNVLDEYNNANNATSFWARVPTDNTAVTGGQFDDVVTWISPSILFSRMVAAGQLP